jgi:hypothetical protein
MAEEAEIPALFNVTVFLWSILGHPLAFIHHHVTLVNGEAVAKLHDPIQSCVTQVISRWQKKLKFLRYSAVEILSIESRPSPKFVPSSDSLCSV